jgi:hypothetical protein
VIWKVGKEIRGTMDMPAILAPRAAASRCGAGLLEALCHDCRGPDAGPGSTHGSCRVFGDARTVRYTFDSRWLSEK